MQTFFDNWIVPIYRFLLFTLIKIELWSFPESLLTLKTRRYVFFYILKVRDDCFYVNLEWPSLSTLVGNPSHIS